MEKYKVFKIDGFEFQCCKFNPHVSTNIFRRLVGYLACAFGESGIDPRLLKEGSIDFKSFSSSFDAGSFGKVLLNMNDADVNMIFDKSVLITEVKKDGVFAPIATIGANGELSYRFDDVYLFLCDAIKQGQFLGQVLSHNFLASLPGIGSIISKLQSSLMSNVSSQPTSTGSSGGQ